MAKEIRVVFNDNEMELYNFVISKSSKSGFLKDLANREKQREEKYINNDFDMDDKIEKLFLKFIAENSIQFNKGKCDNGKNDKDKFEFNVDDIEF